VCVESWHCIDLNTLKHYTYVIQAPTRHNCDLFRYWKCLIVSFQILCIHKSYQYALCTNTFWLLMITKRCDKATRHECVSATFKCHWETGHFCVEWRISFRCIFIFLCCIILIHSVPACFESSVKVLHKFWHLHYTTLVTWHWRLCKLSF